MRSRGCGRGVKSRVQVCGEEGAELELGGNGAGVGREQGGNGAGVGWEQGGP